MEREEIIDIQKNIVIYLMFTKQKQSLKNSRFAGFSEEAGKALAEDGPLAASSAAFLEGVFRYTEEMFLNKETYNFEEARLLLVKLFSSEDATEALVSLSCTAPPDKRHELCRRFAELLHLCRLRSAHDPRTVSKFDLPKP